MLFIKQSGLDVMDKKNKSSVLICDIDITLCCYWRISMYVFIC